MERKVSDENGFWTPLKIAGHFVITPVVHFQFTDHKPNWRTRFFARWLLGWRWEDGE